MRLIDSNALYHDISELIQPNKKDDVPAFGDKLLKKIQEIIDKQPVIDPTTHAQWVGEGDGYADGEIVYDVWNCSNCDYRIDDGTDRTEDLPNYCPECGAKMENEWRKDYETD